MANFLCTFTALKDTNMENKDARENKKIEFQEKTHRKGFQGFPIWVWLLLLVVVAAVYFYLNIKF